MNSEQKAKQVIAEGMKRERGGRYSIIKRHRYKRRDKYFQRAVSIRELYVHKEKKCDYSLYTTSIIHVKTATCFGYTNVAIIRLDI
jgi:hypothetical protein